MTNDKLCDIIGICGCVITSISLGLLFFGVTTAAWGAAFGVLVCGIALFNYE